MRHIQELFKHIWAHSKPSVTLAYSKPWYIQNRGIFRTRRMFRILSNTYVGVFCENSWDYNYFRHPSSRSLLYEINIMIFFNTGLIFTSEVFILYKILWRQRAMARGFWYTGICMLTRSCTTFLKIFARQIEIKNRKSISRNISCGNENLYYT